MKIKQIFDKIIQRIDKIASIKLEILHSSNFISFDRNNINELSNYLKPLNRIEITIFYKEQATEEFIGFNATKNELVSFINAIKSIKLQVECLK